MDRTWSKQCKVPLHGDFCCPPSWLHRMAKYNWTPRLNMLCSLEEELPKEKLCWIKRVRPVFTSSPVNKHSCWVKDLSSEMVGGWGGERNSCALPEGLQQGREVMGQGCGGAVLGPGICCVSQDQLVWGEAILHFQLRQLKYLEWLVWEGFGGKRVWNVICLP